MMLRRFKGLPGATLIKEQGDYSLQRLRIDLSKPTLRHTDLSCKNRTDHRFFTVDNLPSYTANIQAGKLKLLAVSTAQRSALFPEVPTLQESGLNDVDVFGWFGLSASTSTPKTAIQAVSSEIVKTLRDPAVGKRFTDVGANPAPMASPAYQAFIRSELEKWAPLVQSTGMSDT